MNITLFNKKYWLRHFGEQKNIRGYLTAGRADRVVSLNVHPLSPDQQQALPEVERQVKRLEAHGTAELVVANDQTGTKGDLLYYHGDWYECVSAQLWDHTLLSHWNYQFVLVPPDAASTIDTAPPPETGLSDSPTGYEVFMLDLKAATAETPGGVLVRPGSGLTIDSDGFLSVDGEILKHIIGLPDGGGPA